MKNRVQKEINFMKRIIIIIAILTYSCKSDKQKTTKITTSFECPYQEITISEVDEEYNNGSKLSAGLKIDLESNMKLLKKIGEGKINIEVRDTTVLNNVSKQISKKTLYSTNFMGTHNSIIQILCAIEKDLQDSTLSDITRNTLVNEKIKKRTDYFNFLIDNRDSIPNERKKTSSVKRNNKMIKSISRSEGQKPGIITANKINATKEKKKKDNSTTINKVTSINQQGGITANEVHIYEKEKEPELSRENLDILVHEVFNLRLPKDYPIEGGLGVATILHGETLSEFKRYEKKGWLTIKSNGNVTNMGANNRIGNSIEDKKRPWGMGNGFIITFNKSIYED